jgi:hypothetical protein
VFRPLLAMLNLVPQYSTSNSIKIGRYVFRPFLAIFLCTCSIFVTIQVFWDVTLVIWYTCTEFSKCCSAFIFSVKQCSNFLTLNMKVPLSFETSRTIYPTTIRNMSEEWIFSNTAVRTWTVSLNFQMDENFFAPLCCVTWYRFVVWHGTVVSIDIVPLCRVTWYHCVVWRGTFVSIDIVPLCHLTWYRCVVWHCTVLSQLFKMSGFLCTAVVCWLYSSAKLPSKIVLSSTSRTSSQNISGIILFVYNTFSVFLCAK